jgi:hypothetical protein
LNLKILYIFSLLKTPRLYIQTQKGAAFSTYISYVSDETGLVHLQAPVANIDFYNYQIMLSTFYEKKGNAELLANLHEVTMKKIQDETFVKENVLSAKYHVDNMWYRVKFVRTSKQDPQQAVVIYIDFGNKELVDMKNLYIIPDEYKLFKNIPPQVKPLHQKTVTHFQ